MCSVSNVKAQLTAGDIMFVGFNADGNDGFAFVALTAIPATTTIYFTDNSWDGSVFSTTEGTATWVSGAIVPAGNVIILQNTSTGPISSTFGSASLTGSLNLAAGGESLFAYLGATSTNPTTFLSAISTNVYAAPNTLIGTGLTAGTNAISFSGNPDVTVYVGTGPCSVSVSSCAAQIANPVNWASDDGIGAQDNDGVYPDFPANVNGAPFISVLPINLLYFQAKQIESGILLEWSTSSERNNDFFEIEKSSSGLEWKSVQKVEGMGNTHSTKHYTYLDQDFISQTTYYRLSQIDFDGSTKYFPIVSVQPKLNATIRVFPNPSSTVIKIVVANLDKRNLALYDYTGRSQVQFIELLNENEAQIFGNLMRSGVYWLRIDGQVITIVID